MQRFAHRHVALDVFDDDRAVVNEDADRQRKAPQRHGVERLARELDEQHRGDDG